MKFIKRVIGKFVRWAVRDENQDMPVAEPVRKYASTIGSNRHGPDMPGMNFTIFSATGGKVVQFNQYDPMTDRSRQQLYIITDKEDMGQELAHIITMENLSR